MALLCSDPAAFRKSRIRQELRMLKTEMSFVREDITALFNQADLLNLSAIETCGRSMSAYKTSCPTVTNDDGVNDMVMVNSSNAMMKYHSLIKAFVAERQINR